MKRHHIAAARTMGLFAAGAGTSSALLMWGVAATEFMEPTALYETAALGFAALSAAGAVTLGAALTAQHRADAHAGRGC
ncbi:hypothetical protein ACFYXM_11195 [Streptomyces sp. NPDC002476]|uniref:hypothetical protein n=1 Tax=Streptomyces sp. NPDC002476 TaxID=3364648 RepID=UPI0036843957